MILEDTVDLMLSKDHKERFVAEYQQLLIRYKGLNKMLSDWKEGYLNFTPICPRATYESQLKAMEQYLDVLEDRAKLEGIVLLKGID